MPPRCIDHQCDNLNACDSYLMSINKNKSMPRVQSTSRGIKYCMDSNVIGTLSQPDSSLCSLGLDAA